MNAKVSIFTRGMESVSSWRRPARRDQLIGIYCERPTPVIRLDVGIYAYFKRGAHRRHENALTL
jgi:hypothetical protein